MSFTSSDKVSSDTLKFHPTPSLFTEIDIDGIQDDEYTDIFAKWINLRTVKINEVLSSIELQYLYHIHSLTVHNLSSYKTLHNMIFLSSLTLTQQDAISAKDILYIPDTLLELHLPNTCLLSPINVPSFDVLELDGSNIDAKWWNTLRRTKVLKLNNTEILKEEDAAPCKVEELIVHSSSNFSKAMAKLNPNMKITFINKSLFSRILDYFLK